MLDLSPSSPHVFPEPNTGCWICVLKNNQSGYARVRIDGRFIGAHRIAYEQAKGPIPAGLEIDHTCRQSSCVNPDHLEPVTQAENKRRAAENLRRSKGYRCSRGHDLAGTNLYIKPNGRRVCVTCADLARVRHRAKMGAA